MEACCEIILDLENDLSRMKDVSESVPEQLEYAVGQCKVALDRMRKLVVSEGFPDQKLEIYFFKKIKPAVYSKLLYYRAVFEIESNRNEIDIKGQKKYFQQQMDKIKEYMDKHQPKVQYYKCNFKHLDEKYFVRENNEIPMEIRGDQHLLDEDFFTWHDHTFSTIRSNEMLMDYLRKEMEHLESSGKETTEIFKSTLRWTGNKIDFAEILYSIHFSNAVNDGNTTIKELAEAMGYIFNVDVTKDIYKFYIEIKQRKVEKAKFLDHLKAILKRRIDEDDKFQTP
ncbi:tetracycline resistance element mobilization regulatory protein rteC [Aquipluma nitroreducens]|uniref:Tetracycline resistance element mobilization regulatory protein rteC n=1 Tax=Aquipluma nitroreducens TaxID=2010828 RepID=A0A5K7S4P2_9BACT|nr:RteC domain-containing protein [Aquipluma nitroreducens]BBE16324.1 tetracycline resistance element mobilization regulatory protein rteC [Aquipluma nitroreducens]